MWSSVNIAKALLFNRIQYISWLALLSLFFFTLVVDAETTAENTLNEDPQLEIGYIQLNIKNLHIDSFFPVFIDLHERIYLPLSRLFRELELENFFIDWQKQLITGLIPPEDYQYSLNLQTGELNGREKGFFIEPDQYFCWNDEVYLNYQVLYKWLPVSCYWDVFRYELFIDPEFQLVSEILQERQEIREKLLNPNSIEPENVRQVSSTFFTPGIFSYQLDLTTNSFEKITPNLSMGYSGVVFYGDYYGHLEINSLKEVKLKTNQLKYRDLTPGKELVIGDNLLYFSRLLNKTSLIKGLTLTSRDQQYSYGLTSLTGFVPPGSDVELYYRGRLVEYQKTPDGIYCFQNISVEGSSNLYEIWVYPPDGRIYSEKKQVLSQKNLLVPKAADYSAGFGQSAQGFLGTGQLYYGLNQKLTVGGSLTLVEKDDELQKYLGGEMITQLRPNTLLSLESQLDLENWGMGYLAEVSNWHQDLLVKLKYKGYSKMVPPFRDQSFFDDQLLSLTNEVILEMDKRFGDHNLGLSYRLADFHGNWVHQLETRYHQQLSRRTFLNLENRLSFLPSGIDEDLLHATLTYSGLPYLDLKADAKISINRLGIDYYNLYLNLLEKKRINKPFNYSMGMLLSNRRHLDVFLEVEYQIANGLICQGFFDTDGISLSVSFQETRIAEWPFKKIASDSLDTGMISGKVFFDLNGNGSWDVGELVFPEVKILVDGLQEAITDEQGEYFLLDADAYQKLKISLDLKTLDALYLPQEEDIWVQVKPGTELVVDIPVEACSGISGYIVATEKQLQSLRADNLEVVLTTLDGQEVCRTSPEWDGFFILDKIQPGNYWLQVASAKHVFTPARYRLDIPADQMPHWFDGYDFQY